MDRSFRPEWYVPASPVPRPSGTLILLASLGAFFLVGAGTAAGTQQGYFDIRAHGEISKRWTYVQNDPETECEVRRWYIGRERFTFRSRRATRVLVRTRPDGSVALGALLRHISGTYLQTGTRSDRSTNPACERPVAYSTRCSPPRKVANRGGTVSVSAPQKGVVELAKLRLPIRLPRALSACEPRRVAQLPTRVEVASARGRAADIFDPNARTVELEAGASKTTTFSGGDTGKAIVNVNWTVSFEPVG